eukprot:COSAG01_NODE_2582_length_7421_cov_4.252253_2_plen_388_part_00
MRLGDLSQSEAVQLASECINTKMHSCEPLQLWCMEATEAGATVRAFCPQTCGVCDGPIGAAELNVKRDTIEAVLDAWSVADGGTEPAVQIRQIPGSGATYLIVDNFLPKSVTDFTAQTAIESQSWSVKGSTKYANFDRKNHAKEPAQRKALFKPEKMMGGFPGPHTATQHTYEAMAWAQLQRLGLPKVFETQLFKGSLKYNFVLPAFMGNVCFHPKRLHEAQRIPHVDQDRDGEEPQLAILHYLTNWTASNASAADSGGTAFYRERSTNTTTFTPAVCDKLRPKGGSIFCKDTKHYICVRAWKFNKDTPKFKQLCGDKHDYSPLPGRGYIFKSNKRFELLHTVPHVYNRAVIYSAKMLHNAHIDVAALRSLNCDPSRGRVTANMFID